MQLIDIIEHFAQYPEMQTQLVTQTEKYDINQLISTWLTEFFQKYDIKQLLDILTSIGFTFQDNNILKQHLYQTEFRKRYIITIIMHKVFGNQDLMTKYIDSIEQQQSGQQSSKSQMLRQDMIHHVSPIVKLLKLLQQNIDSILKLQQQFKPTEIQMMNTQYTIQTGRRKYIHQANYNKLVEEDFNITNWLTSVQIDLLMLTCECMMKFSQKIIINEIQDYIMSHVEQISKFNIQFDQYGQINIDSHKIFEYITIIGSILSCLGQYYAQHYMIKENEKYSIQNTINEQMVKVIYGLISILMFKISYTYIKESKINEIKQQLQSKLNSNVSSDQDIYQRFLMEICLYFLSVFLMPLLIRTDNVKTYNFQWICDTVDTFKSAINAITYIFKGQQYVFTYVQESLATGTIQIKQQDEDITHTSFLAIYQRKMTQNITKIIPNMITEQNIQIMAQHLVWSIFYGDVQIVQLQQLTKPTELSDQKNQEQYLLILICVINSINTLYSMHTGHYISGIQSDNKWDSVYLNCFYSESFQNSSDNLIQLTKIYQNDNSLNNHHQLHISDIYYQSYEGQNNQQIQSIYDFYGNCQECNKIENIFVRLIKEVLTVDMIYETYMKLQHLPFSIIVIREYLKILEFTKYFNQNSSYLNACKIHECICRSSQSHTMLKTFIQLGDVCKLTILDSLFAYSLGGRQQESLILSIINSQHFNNQNQKLQENQQNEQSQIVENTNPKPNVFNFAYMSDKTNLVSDHIQYYQQFCDFKSIDGIKNMLDLEINQKQSSRYHNFQYNNITNQQQLFQELDSINYKENQETQNMECILMMLNVVNIFCFINGQKINKIKVETQLLALLKTFLAHMGSTSSGTSQNSFLQFKQVLDYSFVDMNLLARQNAIKQAFFHIITQTLTNETMDQIQQIMIYGIKHADIFNKLMVQKTIVQMQFGLKQNKQDQYIQQVIMPSVILDLYEIIQFLQSFTDNQINQLQFQSWRYINNMVHLPNIKQNTQLINDNITQIYNNIIQKQVAISNTSDMFSITQQRVCINKIASKQCNYSYLPFIYPKIYTEHLAKDEQDNTLTLYDIQQFTQKLQITNNEVTDYQQAILLNTAIAFSTQIVKSQYKYNYLYSGAVNSDMQFIICAQVIDNFAKLLSAYITHLKLDIISAQTCIALTTGLIQFIKYHIDNAGFQSILIKNETWTKHLNSTGYNLYVLIFKAYFHLHQLFKEQHGKYPWDECRRMTLELIAQMILLLVDESNGYQIIHYEQQYIQAYIQQMLQQFKSQMNQVTLDSKVQKESNHQFLDVVSPLFILQIIWEVQLREEEIAALLRLKLVETIKLQEFLSFLMQTQLFPNSSLGIDNSLLSKLQSGINYNNKLFDGRNYTILPKIVVKVLEQKDTKYPCTSAQECFSDLININLSQQHVLSTVKELIMMMDQLHQNETNQKGKEIRFLYTKSANYLLKIAEYVMIIDDVGYHLLSAVIRRVHTKNIKKLVQNYDLIQASGKQVMKQIDCLEPGDVMALFLVKVLNRQQNYQNVYQIAKFQPILRQQLTKQRVEEYKYTQKDVSGSNFDIHKIKSENHIINAKEQYILMQLLFLQNPMHFIEYFNVSVFENALVAVQQLLSMSILEDETGFPIFYELLITKQLNSTALQPTSTNNNKDQEVQCDQNQQEELLLHRLVSRQSTFIVFGFQLIILESITTSGRYMTDIITSTAAYLQEDNDSPFQIQSQLNISDAILKGINAVRQYFSNGKKQKITTVNVGESTESLYTAFMSKSPIITTNPAEIKPTPLFVGVDLGIEGIDDNQATNSINQNMMCDGGRLLDYSQLKQGADRLRQYELQLLRFTREWIVAAATKVQSTKPSSQHPYDGKPEYKIGSSTDDTWLWGGHYLSINYFNPICRREVVRAMQQQYKQSIQNAPDVTEQQKEMLKQQVNKFLVQLICKADSHLRNLSEAREVFNKQVSSLLIAISVHFSHISHTEQTGGQGTHQYASGSVSVGSANSSATNSLNSANNPNSTNNPNNLNINVNNLNHNISNLSNHGMSQRHSPLITLVKEAVSDLVQTVSSQYASGELDSGALLLLVDAIGKHFSRVPATDESVQAIISAIVDICSVCSELKVVERCCGPLRALQLGGAQLTVQARLLVIGHLVWVGKVEEAIGLQTRMPAAFLAGEQHLSFAEGQGDQSTQELIRAYHLMMLLEAARAFQLYDSIKVLIDPVLALYISKQQPKQQQKRDSQLDELSKLIQIVGEDFRHEFAL